MAKKKKKVVASEPSDIPIDFEQSFARVEEIVRELEQGQIGLGQSLEKYELGVKHLKQCYSALERAQRRIELLTGIDRDGNARSIPFEQNSDPAEDRTPASDKSEPTLFDDE